MANITSAEPDSQRHSQEISDSIVRSVGMGCFFVTLFILFLILFYAIIKLVREHRGVRFFRV